MTQQHHLNNATWDCKYHVVFIPKYRKKAVFGKIKKNLGAVFHDLARRREYRIEEGHLMPDHVHMLGLDPAEILGCRGDRLHQGQKLDLDRAEYRAERRRTSPGINSGHAGISSRRWAGTRRRSALTSRNQELQDRQMDQLALIP